MLRLRADDPLAASLVAAIRAGDLPSLKRLLREHPALTSATIGEVGKSRTLLHVATDWPGHFPNGAAVVTALIDAGADPNVRREDGQYPETPLHWVASNDDVEVFAALEPLQCLGCIAHRNDVMIARKHQTNGFGD